jgi:hypothetical protein
MDKRFKVALSFAGEKREFVREVACYLSEKFGSSRILYDKIYEVEFGKAKLKEYLANLYRSEAELIVAIICPNYPKKEWCRNEKDVICSLIKEGNIKMVMLSNFNGEVLEDLNGEGGYIPLDNSSAEDFAINILVRLAQNEDKYDDFYLSFPERSKHVKKLASSLYGNKEWDLLIEKNSPYLPVPTSLPSPAPPRTAPKFSLKIFLSHTNEFSDYPQGKSYVTHAREAVEKFGHKCIEMEAFTAVLSSPEDNDARLVKKCDVYIGIIGMRYGSMTSEGISHTEHEYNTALKENKKIFLFILDGHSIDHKLPVEVLHSGAMHKNQDAFKNKVKSNHIVKFFKSPDHLYILICDALRELDQTPLDWSWPSPWDFGPYRSERCKVFHGREWLFTKVREWAQDPNAERALLLTAGYGVGKTAFLAKLITDQLSGLPLAAEHFCQGGIKDTLSPGIFVRSVAAQLATTLPSYRWLLLAPEASDLRKLLEAAAQKPAEAWDQAVVAMLHRIPTPETHFLLVVDALDVALGHRPAMGEAVGVTIVDLLARNTSPPLG